MRLSRAAVGAAVVRGPAGASARTADAWPWAHAFHVRLALHCPRLTTRPAKPSDARVERGFETSGNFEGAGGA